MPIPKGQAPHAPSFPCAVCMSTKPLTNVLVGGTRARAAASPSYPVKRSPRKIETDEKYLSWKPQNLTVPLVTHVKSTYTATHGRSAMLLDLGGPLVSSHAALHPLLPHTDGLSPPRLPFSDDQHSKSSRSRRRRRPNSVALGPRLLHPNGGGPEGVPSSLFTFKPRAAPKYTSQQEPSGGSIDAAAAADNATGTAAVGKDGVLYAGLMEESDLPDISALLVEVRTAGAHKFVLFRAMSFMPRRTYARVHAR